MFDSRVRLSAVAGGMDRGRSGPSLGERAASSGVVPAGGRTDLPADPRRLPVPADPSNRQPPPGHRDGAGGGHCWVHVPANAPGTGSEQLPGLLVEWRRRRGGWEGRVAYTVAGLQGPTLVEAWLPAERLEPR